MVIEIKKKYNTLIIFLITIDNIYDIHQLLIYSIYNYMVDFLIE